MSLTMTPIFAAAFAVFALILSARVILSRRRHGVSLGSGGQQGLERSIRAHANLLEYVPLSLILLALFELNAGPAWICMVAGGSLLIGRTIHAWSIISASGGGRVAGMTLTFASWFVLVPGNLWLILS